MDCIDERRQTLCYFVEPDVKHLVRTIEAGSWFMLFGPRGAGKTTAALYAMRKMAQRKMMQRGWRCFYINCSSFLVNPMWEELYQQFQHQPLVTRTWFPQFDSASSFTAAFGHAAFRGAKVLLVFDAFDTLTSINEAAKAEVRSLPALPRDNAARDLNCDALVRTCMRSPRPIARIANFMSLQFLAALGDINRTKHTTTVVSAIAIGAFAAVPDAPFAETPALAAPFFTREDVSALLHAFAADHRVTVDEGIIDDVLAATAGHPALVGVCGCALELLDRMGRLPGNHISLVAWRQYRARFFFLDLLHSAPLSPMMPALASMQDRTLQLLQLHVDLPDLALTAEGDRVQMAQQLAADGWLVPAGTTDAFRIASPLARIAALHGIACRMPGIDLPARMAPDGYLNLHEAIVRTLPMWDGAAMQRAFAAGSTAVAGSRPPVAATQVAPYHSQLFIVLKRCLSRSWLSQSCKAFDVLAEADTCGTTAPPASALGQHADMMLCHFHSCMPTHLLGLTVRPTAASVAASCNRIVAYMAANEGVQGACIAFTMVGNAADVNHRRAAGLSWPTQLAEGLDVMHVVHDAAWTKAVLWRHRKGATARAVDIVLHG